MVFSLFPHTLWFVQTCSWEIPIKQWGISSEPCLLLREQISWYQLVGDSARIAGLIVSLIKGYTTFKNWLVVWNMNFIYPYIGKNHPKLTNSFIFQRGRSTTNQFHDIMISISAFFVGEKSPLLMVTCVHTFFQLLLCNFPVHIPFHFYFPLDIFHICVWDIW